MMTVYRNSNECINIYRMLISMIGNIYVVERLFMVELRCYKCGQSNGVRTTGVGLATDSWDGNYKCSENGDGNYMVDCTGSCWVRKISRFRCLL